jgi:hypothetical protein
MAFRSSLAFGVTLLSALIGEQSFVFRSTFAGGLTRSATLPDLGASRQNIQLEMKRNV